MSPLLFGTAGSPHSSAPPKSIVEGVRRVAELGLDGMELEFVHGVRMPEAEARQIAAIAGNRGLRLSVHAPYYINLNGDEEKWPRLRKYLMDAARFGALAGATDIIFHPGSYFGRPAADVLAVTIPRLQGCLDELRAEGSRVTLRPETSGKAAMLGSLQDTLAMAKAIEGVVPCLDFAHLHARLGDGSMNTYAEWMQALEDYRRALGKRALQHLHIHLSGIEYGPKGEKHHVPMEAADLDFKNLFRALHDSGARGRLMCESPRKFRDSLRLA